MGPQNNWVFTQHIDKFSPLETYYTVRVCVSVTFTIFSCGRGCSRCFEILYSIANARRNYEMYTNTSSYIPLKRICIRHSQTVTVQIYFNLTHHETGFYIALRDPSSCISVSRVLVFRYECHKKQDHLVIFPQTAAPADESIYINTICVSNASNITSLEVKCSKDGVWSGTPECYCLPGFKLHVDIHSCVGEQ